MALETKNIEKNLLGLTSEQAEKELEGAEYSFEAIETPWISQGEWRVIKVEKQEKRGDAFLLTVSLFQTLDSGGLEQN